MNRSTLIPALALIACAPLAAQAQGSDDWRSWPTAQSWTISAGYFLPSLDTKIIITDAEGNIGTGISFEDNLGLDDSKGTGIVAVDWRFFKRHSLAYGYFSLERAATGESSVAVGIGDEIFDITLPIQSFFDITANELSYSYSVLLDERKDLFLGVGLSVQDLSLGIRGTASSPAPGEIINSTLASTAPLPTLNIGFNYAFSDNWLFVSKLGWLAVDVDLGTDEKLEGQIINANIGVEWRAFENVGFFAKYQMFDVNVDITNERSVFAIDYDYNGPLIGVSARF